MSPKKSFVFTRTIQNQRTRQAEFDFAIKQLKAQYAGGAAWPLSASEVCLAIGISSPTACGKRWKPLFDAARKKGLIQSVNRKAKK